MLGRLLVTVFGLFILTSLVLMLLLCSLPLFKRVEFDAVCHHYARVMDQSGGLPPSAAAALATELERRHFTVLQIQAPEQSSFGQTMQLSVEAACPGQRITPDMRMEAITWHYSCAIQLDCRVYTTGDAVP